MKRGGIRTARKYVIEDEEKRIKFEIQGKKNGTWIPVVEKDSKTGVQIPMIYDTIKEAETKLKEIVRQIRGNMRK
jgi:hypothetical protein